MKNTVFRKFILIGVGVFVALFIVEVALRLLHFNERSTFYVYDHDRGIGLRPNAEGWWNKEGGNYERINSRGLHDREHALVKPPGTLRVAVLGDSYTEALHVPLEDAFWAVAERDLQQCGNLGNRRIEMLNFGVSGYGTAQELITLRSQVWDYSPDIVLLAFTTGNDLNDNFKQLSSDPMRPYFVLKDGKLTLDRSSLDARESSWRYSLRYSVLGRSYVWLSERLRALQLITSATRAIATDARGTSPSQVDKPANQNVDASDTRTKPVPTELGLDGMVYYEPLDENWQEAWRVTETMITQMQSEVVNKGAKFYVVTLSSAPQVSPSAQDYQALLKSYGLTDLFYPDFRIRALGQNDDFPVLNLAPLLKDYAEQHNVYLHGSGEQKGSGHWNQVGHRAAGHILANWMCTQLAR